MGASGDDPTTSINTARTKKMMIIGIIHHSFLFHKNLKRSLIVLILSNIIFLKSRFNYKEYYPY